jgi:hypothetical protein
MVSNVYKTKYSNIIYEALNEDLSNIDKAFRSYEEVINDEVKTISDELNKMPKLDLTYLDNPQMDGAIFYAFVNQSLNQTISNCYKYMDSNSNNYNELTNELLQAAKKEVSKNINDFIISNEESKSIDEFIKNPTKQFERYNVKPIKIVDEDIKENEDLEDESLDDILVSETEKKYLDLIDENEQWQSRDLAPKILELIRKYDKDRLDFVSKNPDKGDEFPTLGVFINNLRNKVINIATFEEGLDLGNDKNGEFVKRFLDNPIKSLNTQLDNQIKALEDANILDNVYLVDEESLAQNEKIININNAFKERLNADASKYNKLNANKPNLWKEHQSLKANWFNKVFNNKTKQSINVALENNKGGFFERLFNTTSKEFKALKEGLNQMMDEGVEKGDLDGLQDKADKYLFHKLKSYDSLNHTYDQNEFDKLDATSKGRVRLCINVIESINDAQKAIIKNLNIDEYPGNAQKINEKVKLDTFDFLKDFNMQKEEQAIFQDDLKKASSLDNDNLIYNKKDDEIEINENEISNDSI